jgi:hypothetical protein
MARAAKEAVMIVIDTSASMAEPYPIHGASWCVCNAHHVSQSCPRREPGAFDILPSPPPHTPTGLAAKGGEQQPPPSKLEVAKELATLMLADRAVAEQVALDWLPSPFQPD